MFLSVIVRTRFAHNYQQIRKLYSVAIKSFIYAHHHYPIKACIPNNIVVLQFMRNEQKLRKASGGFIDVWVL